MTGPEQGLREIALETRMEVVITRQPLVYGPGVNDNFAAMMRGLKRGVLVSLGAIYNRRSLVTLDNLVDLIVTCLTDPAAATRPFWYPMVKMFRSRNCCGAWARPWGARRV
jgi:nucleoside-diphosphate-sugar epimerase